MSKLNYATGHAYNISLIFNGFPIKKMKMTSKECDKYFSDTHKKDIAASIFARGVEMVVDDIIENNTHFKLPGIGKTLAYLYMGKTLDSKFKKAFRNGKWNDVDFLMSNFTGYLLTFEMQSERRLPRSKTVYLDSKKKERITELTNEGKLY